MDEFDAGRQRAVALAAAVAAEFRRGQGQHRPQPLAAGRDNMAGQLRDQRHRTLHLLDDPTIDGGHVVFDEAVQHVQRRLDRLFLFDADDCQRISLFSMGLRSHSEHSLTELPVKWTKKRTIVKADNKIGHEGNITNR
jgi:hypothetical protein